MDWFEGFEAGYHRLPGGLLHARIGGRADRPALLLLHGFPQSHVMWHRVAQRLREDFFLVLPDLRGYGDSMKPHGLPEHVNYSKRTMAQDLVDLMRALDRQEFFVCGHDRGGRVAYRMALDHPDRVSAAAVLDVVPTGEVWSRADAQTPATRAKGT